MHIGTYRYNFLKKTPLQENYLDMQEGIDKNRIDRDSASAGASGLSVWKCPRYW